ncbi:hypothetical protein C8J56DRAFT_898363 [Mycena floridula]|nr:hypothetical protein C8J56DRAFT_898363 [Mycena floridula]
MRQQQEEKEERDENCSKISETRQTSTAQCWRVTKGFEFSELQLFAMRLGSLIHGPPLLIPLPDKLAKLGDPAAPIFVRPGARSEEISPLSSFSNQNDGNERNDSIVVGVSRSGFQDCHRQSQSQILNVVSPPRASKLRHGATVALKSTSAQLLIAEVEFPKNKLFVLGLLVLLDHTAEKSLYNRITASAMGFLSSGSNASMLVDVAGTHASFWPASPSVMQMTRLRDPDRRRYEEEEWRKP